MRLFCIGRPGLRTFLLLLTSDRCLSPDIGCGVVRPSLAIPWAIIVFALCETHCSTLLILGHLYVILNWFWVTWFAWGEDSHNLSRPQIHAATFSLQNRHWLQCSGARGHHSARPDGPLWVVNWKFPHFHTGVGENKGIVKSWRPQSVHLVGFPQIR